MRWPGNRAPLVFPLSPPPPSSSSSVPQLVIVSWWQQGGLFRKTGLACFEVPEFLSASSSVRVYTSARLWADVTACVRVCVCVCVCVCVPHIDLMYCVTVTNCTAVVLPTWIWPNYVTSLGLHSKSPPRQRGLSVNSFHHVSPHVCYHLGHSRYGECQRRLGACLSQMKNAAGDCWVHNRNVQQAQHDTGVPLLWYSWSLY